MSEITIKMGADKYKVSRATLWYWINQGHIPSVRRRWGKYNIEQHMFKEEDLNVFLSMKNRKPKEKAPLIEETPEPEHPKSEFGKKLMDLMISIKSKQFDLNDNMARLNQIQEEIMGDLEMLKSKVGGFQPSINYEKRISEMEGREAVLDRILKDFMQKK